MATTDKRSIVLAFAKEHGVIKARDMDALGVSRRYARNLADAGIFQQVGRGLFTLADHTFTGQHDLARVAKRSSNGVICLISALHFHDIGTQFSHGVWLALPNHSHAPKTIDIPLSLVHMSAPTLHAGVEHHTIEGVDVKIFSAAKTIADCFKYASHVGSDVCLEALKDGLARNLVTRDDLYKFAQVNRVWTKIQPYMEALS
jgi:predicted transcriptional regulator of viral defense system